MAPHDCMQATRLCRQQCVSTLQCAQLTQKQHEHLQKASSTTPINSMYISQYENVEG